MNKWIDVFAYWYIVSVAWYWCTLYKWRYSICLSLAVCVCVHLSGSFSLSLSLWLSSSPLYLSVYSYSISIFPSPFPSLSLSHASIYLSKHSRMTMWNLNHWMIQWQTYWKSWNSANNGSVNRELALFPVDIYNWFLTCERLRDVSMAFWTHQKYFYLVHARGRFLHPSWR